MYKTASRMQQAKLRRPIGEYLPSYYESLTDEQKRDCLKAKLLSVEADLLQEKDKWRKRELGLLKCDLASAMSAIRPKKRSPGVDQYFIDAARLVLTKELFNLVMTKANELMKEPKDSK